MAIHIQATYENGVLRPNEPLDLPNCTPVHVTVVPQNERLGESDDLEETLPDRPPITVEQFERIMSQGVIRAGTLSLSFDRDDIYSDHD